jgi:hypothetical protein
MGEKEQVNAEPVGAGREGSLEAAPSENINPVQNHREFARTQFHRTRSLFHSRHFENSGFQSLVPQHEAIPVPSQNLQPITTS